MSIQRYDGMPFYIKPAGGRANDIHGNFVEFLDFLVDAHEENRNRADLNRTFYYRSVYVYNNFFRYLNPTMSNVMFDT